MSLLRTRTISKTTLQWKKQNKQKKHVFFSCLGSAYPFLNSLYPFFWVSFLFVICAHEFEIDEVTIFINFCLFSAYLGTYKWSVVLPSNVTDLKYAQWLKSPRPFKKWAVKVTHPTPLCLCMHGILVIRTITWLYRLCRIY